MLMRYLKLSICLSIASFGFAIQPLKKRSTWLRGLTATPAERKLGEGLRRQAFHGEAMSGCGDSLTSGPLPFRYRSIGIDRKIPHRKESANLALLGFFRRRRAQTIGIG